MLISLRAFSRKGTYGCSRLMPNDGGRLGGVASSK
jgi:hypothetical protein